MKCTEGFKQKTVHEVLSGKLNKRQASLINGIKGNATILCWIRETQLRTGYGNELPSIANFAVEVAEKKLGIDIVKKYGVQPSNVYSVWL